jgi:general transcription factor 3C polypeptide 5 (transcription factor C subunit 1)
MNTILVGDKPDDSIYQRIVGWPEVWDDKTFFAQYAKEFYNREMTKERRTEHVIMKSVRYAARNPRYAFERLEAQKNRIAGAERPGADEMEEDDVEVEEDMTEIPERAEDILNEGAENESEDDEEDEAEDDDDGDIPGEKIFDEDGNEILGNDVDEEVDGEWEVDDVATTFGFGGFYDV